jgi:hypothetical protein
MIVSPAEGTVGEGMGGDLVYDGLPDSGPPYEFEIPLPDTTCYFIHITLVNESGHAHGISRAVERVPEPCLAGTSVVLPTRWDLAWPESDRGNIRWYLGGNGQFDVRGVDAASLRLNGVVQPVLPLTILPSMGGFVGPVLVARFPRGAAVHSLEVPLAGQRTAVLTGVMPGIERCLNATATVTVVGRGDGGASMESPATISEFVLEATGPQPSGQSVGIRFGVPEAGRVQLAVFDVSGRVVRRLADEQFSPGYHDLTWDGRTEDGRLVSADVYFLQGRFEQGSVLMKRLVILPR